MSFKEPSAGIGLENLWGDLNTLLERWPDKEHQYYKDLYNLLEDYSTSPDRPTRLPDTAGTRSYERGYQLEPWMESNMKQTIKNMVLQEVYLILNGADPEDQFLRENEPAPSREEFAATAAEEAAIINQQINAQGPDEYGMEMALSTNQADWDKHGIHTGEDLAKEMLLSTYSDMYKSFHGFRPRGGVSRDMSVDELNQAVTDLEQYIESYHGAKAQDQDPGPEPHTMQGDASKDEPGDYEEFDSKPSYSGMGRRSS